LKIQAVTETLQTKTTAIASDLVTLANSIKTEIYGKLNETVAAVPKYDDAPLKTALETMNKTYTENLAQTTQKIALIESENLKVKETFEKLLDKADKNITEVQKTLEQREKELKETSVKLEAQGKELAETKNKLQETATLAENTNDKLKPQFKASAKQTVAKVSSSTFNPYDPTRK
jgi:chromosome segregation ATPase